MNLCDYNTIRDLLARHGFHFSKSMGQNFLIDPEVPRRIAEASGADAGCGVLEIGPGIGPLTAELAQRAGNRHDGGAVCRRKISGRDSDGPGAL